VGGETPDAAVADVVGADQPLTAGGGDGVALRSLSATLVLTIGVFAVVPNISAYLQYKLGYPRDRLGFLYLVGGAFSFATLRVAGYLVDRLGISRVLLAGTVLHSLALWLGFISPPVGVPVLLVFCGYMVSGSVRMVPIQSLATRVPQPHQRARFLSAQSALRHAGSALGSLAGAMILISEPSGRLERIPLLAGGALIAAWLVVPLALRVESAVRRREREESPSPEPIAPPAIG
jgi:predicted MFS family arabinose efflux permease